MAKAHILSNPNNKKNGTEPQPYSVFIAIAMFYY